jgi:archaea-specific DNA-binding protein
MNADRTTVFIGSKPPMNYVLAVVALFEGGAGEVHIRARGRAISRAVDVAEIVRHQYVQEAQVADVKIGTERITDERGRNSNVSSITITLTKPPGGAPRKGGAKAAATEPKAVEAPPAAA